uniref:Uncharacterized protein n=1 Tax=Magallana gigas TaxID=29159 RepID=A0A8W8LXQ2_MAGGI
MKRGKKPPTPRDVFAAAEMLQTYIYITRFDKSVDRNIAELQGYIFAPTSKQNLDIAMLCLILHKRRDGSVEFARIDRQENIEHLMPCPGKIVNIDHKHCFGLRFLNDFSVLFEQTVAYGQKYDVNDFFRRMSLEFYGTENHHDRVMNIICDFELKEGNLDVFSKYTGEKITNETSVREKKKILGRHVEQVRKRLKPVGEGEFYALSSVYNVDVIIDDHRKESENTCSCRQQKPKIHGRIGKVKADIIEEVFQKTCCQPLKRKQNHTHLIDIPDITREWPKRTRYVLQTPAI